MKYIRWVGAPIIIAAGVLATMLAGAADGDPIVELASDEHTLTAGQRSQLATFVSGRWPAAAPADIYLLRCQRRGGKVKCKAGERAVYTAAQFSQLEDDGELWFSPEPEDIAADGSTVTASRKLPPVQLGAAAVSQLASWVSGIWGIDGGVIRALEVRRDGSAIKATLYYLGPVSPTERLQCLRAGTCRGRFGTVGE